jgi:hypothetical protein
MQIMVVVQKCPEGHSAPVNTTCNSSPFRSDSGHRLDNRGVSSQGMGIAGHIAACSADPPLDRWNGWVNCPLSSGMMKLGFSLHSA